MILRIVVDQGSSAGALQVVEIRDELDRDYTFLVDYDTFFFSLTEIRAALAARLAVDPDTIELEEV